MEHYTPENTEGYTDAERAALNAELDAQLEGIEPYTDTWYAIIKRHADEVAQR